MMGNHTRLGRNSYLGRICLAGVSALALAAATPLHAQDVAADQVAPAAQPETASTVGEIIVTARKRTERLRDVLVHGGGYGGWAWKPVVELLRAAGHEVYAPTLSGLAERSGTPHAATGTDFDPRLSGRLRPRGRPVPDLDPRPRSCRHVPGLTRWRLPDRADHLGRRGHRGRAGLAIRPDLSASLPAQCASRSALLDRPTGSLAKSMFEPPVGRTRRIRAVPDLLRPGARESGVNPETLAVWPRRDARAPETIADLLLRYA